MSDPTTASGALAVLDRLRRHFGSLSDAQLAHYGRYLLAAAGIVYLSASFKSDVPADAQYAIDAHVPQGYDRSIIGARLEQRHTRQVLQSCLQLGPLREQLRAETDRDAKLRGWDEVLRRTLVSMLASAYTHSLTIALHTVKNTARVLVFVLCRREEAAAERRAGGGAGRLSGSGPLSKVRAWWHGGTQAVMLEMAMARMAAQRDLQASPFANAGFDEEAVPTVPVDGRDAFAYAQAISQDLAAAANGEDTDDSEERGLTGVEREPRWPPGSSCLSTDSAASTAAAAARAERLFSVKDTLAYAIPRIVATATEVVARVLARYPAGAFGAAATVSSNALRGLLAELCEEMERAACVVAWVHPPLSGSRRASEAPSSPVSPAARTTAAASPAPWSEDGPVREDGVGDTAEGLEGDGDDMVRFPAGSTAVLGPDGVPLPRWPGGRASSGGSGGGLFPRAPDAAVAPLSDEAFMAGIFGTPPRPSAEVRRQHREAMRRRLVLRQQTTGFFQEMIHSASFGELCIDYADTLLAKALCAAADLTGVKSYDPASNTARMLMVIAALEGHRQRLLDSTELEVPPSMKLFCEETVRSTCSQV